MKKQRRRWDDSLTPEAARLYKSGRSCAEIGEFFGYHANTVRNNIKRAGVSVAERPGRIPDDVRQRIIELYNAGMTTAEIGQRCGVNPAGVPRIARKAGCKMRGKGSNSRNGGLAAIKKLHKIQRDRSDGFARHHVHDSTNGTVEAVRRVGGRTWLLRCRKCGNEYTRYMKSDHSCACRICNPPSNRRITDEEREYRAYCKEQQHIAAREWRMSVPLICKECGEPFYSEHYGAAYCTPKCKHVAKRKRRKDSGYVAPRRPGSNKGPARYKRRMVVPICKETYDRTVTLKAVYEKHKGICCQCKTKTVRSKHYRPDRATLDHVIALANGGTHTWDNVQLLCAACNSEKRDLGQMRLAI